MSPCAPDTLIQALNWRYATKVFDPARKISAADLNTLEQSLVLTPSSFGLQPYRFLVVTDPGLREKLREASWGQAQVTDCSHLFVFLARKRLTEADVDHLIDRIVQVHGEKRENLAGYRSMMVNTLVAGARAATVPEWAARQAYIALGQFMASAAMLGLDTCPMEGLDPATYDEILGLKDTPFRTVVACPVGYRAPVDKYAALPKVRFPVEELVESR
ncbi:MAG: NAD(P)H-dependent oxidoreductase [Holophaga sp.]|jgi:nitroreductase